MTTLEAIRQQPDADFDELFLPLGLKEHLTRMLLEPVNKKEKLEEYSFILFGPPGTGKTTIPYAIANKLDWEVFYFGPQTFAQSSDSVEKSINEYFQLIKEYSEKAQEANEILSTVRQRDNNTHTKAEIVFIFDEIDELVLTRTSDQDRQTRYATTMMLPLFNQLRKWAKEYGFVSFVLTNHIERFDPAIKRVGRFDSIIPIGPPDRTARYNYFERELNKLRSHYKKYNIDLRYNTRRVGNITLEGLDFDIVSRISSRLGFGDIEMICKKAVEQRLLMQPWTKEMASRQKGMNEIRITTKDIISWINKIRESNTDIQKEIELFYQEFPVYSRGATPYVENNNIQERIHHEFASLDVKDNFSILKRSCHVGNQSILFCRIRNLSEINSFDGEFIIAINGAGISVKEKRKVYLVPGKSSSLVIIPFSPTKVSKLKISYKMKGHFLVAGIASTLKKQRAKLHGTTSIDKIIKIEN